MIRSFLWFVFLAKDWQFTGLLFSSLFLVWRAVWGIHVVCRRKSRIWAVLFLSRLGVTYRISKCRWLCNGFYTVTWCSQALIRVWSLFDGLLAANSITDSDRRPSQGKWSGPIILRADINAHVSQRWLTDSASLFPNTTLTCLSRWVRKGIKELLQIVAVKRRRGFQQASIKRGPSTLPTKLVVDRNREAYKYVLYPRQFVLRFIHLTLQIEQACVWRTR